MSSERLRQVEEIYHAVRARDEEERAAFLQQACCGDSGMLREVDSLLAHAGQAENFLESSALLIMAGGAAPEHAGRLLGAQIGSYKVLSLLGSGGMGEVYLAEDQSLDRKVALKILPEELLHDPAARKRFLREAKSAAALDHPFVCDIFEVGEAEGRGFIAMEFVEGHTLRNRLRQGQIPLQDVLQITAEIAEALAAAHSQSIIHRDLKPSNIMLTRSGHVKVVDFGLAKRVGSGPAPHDVECTITSATPAGLTVGTPAYMSPEQLRGQQLDVTSDIFSLGIICYEMVAGVHPFRRPELAETISAILKEDPPPLARYRDVIPDLLQHIVRKMLAKETVNRYRSAHEICSDVALIPSDGELSGPLKSAAGPLPLPATWRTALPWLLLPVVVTVTWILSRAFITQEAVNPAPGIRFTISVPEGRRLTTDNRRGVAVSPDGRLAAFVGGTVVDVRANPRTDLFVRALNDPQIRLIPGTTNGLNPVFSPDGAELAFLDGVSRVPRKVAVDGGEPVTLCECTAEFGIDWGEDNTVIFGSRQGLWRVPASGGYPELITRLDESTGEVGHFLPQLLPGGEAVVFTAVRYKSSGTKDWKRARIFVHSFKTGGRTFLIEGGSDARYVPSGHLVFAREGRLMAVRFDLRRLQVSGTPVQILEGIHHSIHTGSSQAETGVAQFSFSDTGLLAYIPGSVFPEYRTAVAWMDRRGRKEVLDIEPKSYFSVRLSPDQKRVLLSTIYPPRDVWLYDLERRILRRQTFEGNHTWAIWGPGPEEFTSDSDAVGPDGIYTKTIDSGPGLGRKLPTGLDLYQKPSAWSPDGKTLAIAVLDPETGPDIWMLSGGTAKPYLKTRFSESSPEFSPDGRWLAYVSDETRRPEVYVRSFPGPGRPIQVSTGGGAEPGWSADGTEIFYRSDSTFFAARIGGDAEGLRVGRPIALFEGSLGAISSPVRSWDLSADGHFLVRQGLGEAAVRAMVEEVNPTRIDFVQNWFDELRRLIPTGP